MAITHLPTPFKEFLDLLNVKQVEYLLIGGYAVNIHGYHRATGDMDIWIAVSSENSTRMVDVFQDFGFGSLRLDLESLNREDVIISIGAPPLKIEVMTSIAGVNFNECFRDRVQIEVDGTRLNLINLQRLLENKAATGRLKDLADVEALGKLR